MQGWHWKKNDFWWDQIYTCSYINIMYELDSAWTKFDV